MKVKYFLVLILTVFIAGCRENPPVNPDGQCELIIKAFYPNPDTLASVKYLPAGNAKVVISSAYGIMIQKTNAEGILYLTGIPSADYKYSVTLDHPLYTDFYLSANSREIELRAGKPYRDTIYTQPVTKGGVCINELYVSAPKGSGAFYGDQFIELYNSKDDVRYLDGFMVMKFIGSNSKGIEYLKGAGSDEGDDGDIDGATIIYKFPGKPGERNYPILPKTFVVLALTAMDFTKFFPNSIDLSKADWEFYNPSDFTDIDNPGSRNLINMRSDKTSTTAFSLTNGVVVISDGRDTSWEDGIDIQTVIDAVQYSRPGQSNYKTLDSRVDKSYIWAPSSYSGQSMQRRKPGLDTDDAILDWEIISKPTPGRQ